MSLLSCNLFTLAITQIEVALDLVHQGLFIMTGSFVFADYKIGQTPHLCMQMGPRIKYTKQQEIYFIL